MTLNSRLAEIHRRFLQSHLSLVSFVQDSQKSIQHLLGEHDRILRKLQKPTRGRTVTGAKKKDRLIEVRLTPEEMAVLKKAMTWRVEQINKHPNLLLRMSLIHLVAIFDGFIADVFAEVLTSRPDMLRSKKQLSYETILSIGSSDNLVRYMASREINEIGYKSTRDQWSYYAARFGTEIDKSEVELEKLVEMYAERNLLVHNNGIVNEFYLETVAVPLFNLKEEIEITFTRWAEFAMDLRSLAAFIHQSLTDKFGGEKTPQGDTNA